MTCCTMKRKLAVSVLMYVVGARFDGRLLARRFPGPPARQPSCCCCLLLDAGVVATNTDSTMGGEDPEANQLQPPAPGTKSANRGEEEHGSSSEEEAEAGMEKGSARATAASV